MPLWSREHVAVFEGVLGTTIELRLDTWRKRSALAAQEAALGEIERLTSIFSRFDSESELSRWQTRRGVWVEVSPELREVLAQAQLWSWRTEGALHPGVGALHQLWRNAERLGREPSERERRAVLTLLREPLWSLRKGQARLETACELTLDALAKGYIVDRACRAAARTPGVSGILLSLGGDMKVLGRAEVSVGVSDPLNLSDNAPPLARLSLRAGEALATSGGLRRGYRVGGCWYAHLLDPSTALPCSAVVQASALAPDALTADALATAACLLPVERTLALAQSLPGCEVMVIGADAVRSMTPGWRKRLLQT